MRFGARFAVVVAYGLMMLVVAPVAIADGPDVWFVTTDTTLSTGFSGSIIVVASDVTLDCAGESIVGPGYDFADPDDPDAEPDIQAGVVVEAGANGVTVENCVISGFDTSGGIVVGGTNTTVRSNTVDSSQGGIAVFTSDNTIVGNRVTNSEFDGFLLLGDLASGNLLQGNHAEDNGSDFTLEFADNNTLVDNVAVGGGFQIAFSSANILMGNNATGAEVGFALSNAHGNTLRANSASASTFGIQLWDATDSKLVGNTAHDNLVDGFSLVSSTGIQVRDNHSHRNGVGFAVVGALDAANVLAGNTAEENTFGFLVEESSGNTLKANHAILNEDGYQLLEASQNTLKGNTASNNLTSFVLYDSSNNTLKNNVGVSFGGGDAFYFDIERESFDNVLKHNTGCLSDPGLWEDSNEFKGNDFTCPS